MPFNNNSDINIIRNPLVDSMFCQGNEETLVPPVGEAFIITEDGLKIVTETGDFIVTE